MDHQVYLDTLDGYWTALSLGGIASMVTIPWTGLYGFFGYFACAGTLGFLIFILDLEIPR